EGQGRRRGSGRPRTRRRRTLGRGAVATDEHGTRNRGEDDERHHRGDPEPTSHVTSAYARGEPGTRTRAMWSVAWSVLALRVMPARSPRATNFSAILRLASSIISSPNITAPRRSSSVAVR